MAAGHPRFSKGSLVERLLWRENDQSMFYAPEVFPPWLFVFKVDDDIIESAFCNLRCRSETSALLSMFSTSNNGGCASMTRAAQREPYSGTTSVWGASLCTVCRCRGSTSRPWSLSGSWLSPRVVIAGRPRSPLRPLETRNLSSTKTDSASKADQTRF